MNVEYEWNFIFSVVFVSMIVVLFFLLTLRSLIIIPKVLLGEPMKNQHRNGLISYAKNSSFFSQYFLASQFLLRKFRLEIKK